MELAVRITQCRSMDGCTWSPALPEVSEPAVQLVLVFGSRRRLGERAWLETVMKTYPAAILFGCSTAGEILDTNVCDDTLVLTAVHFEHTRVRLARIQTGDHGSSREAGQALASMLDPDGLSHVLVLSDGLAVNGSELVDGLRSGLPADVALTGGLSADGARFAETLVVADGPAASGQVAALGLYGDHLRIGYGSLGGWDPFGPERVITRSHGNKLYELDGRSALDLYTTYLGEHAAGLPATGLLFPLSLRSDDNARGVVRSVLRVNAEERSMTFAGDMPEGSYARLMRANFERLIDGATGAARASAMAFAPNTAELAILISCVGRKLVLKQRIEEEVEGVREVLGPHTALTGFYSYGEISPFTPSARCELHNQTMTITTFAEV